jgi:hypothetical protein
VKVLAVQLRTIKFAFTPPLCFTGPRLGSSSSWEEELKGFFEIYLNEYLDANKQEMAERGMESTQELAAGVHDPEVDEAEEAEEPEGTRSKSSAKPAGSKPPRVYHNLLYSSEALNTLMVRIFSWFGPKALQENQNNSWAGAGARSFCATIVSYITN